MHEPDFLRFMVRHSSCLYFVGANYKNPFDPKHSLHVFSWNFSRGIGASFVMHAIRLIYNKKTDFTNFIEDTFLKSRKDFLKDFCFGNSLASSKTCSGARAFYLRFWWRTRKKRRMDEFRTSDLIIFFFLSSTISSSELMFPNAFNFLVCSLRGIWNYLKELSSFEWIITIGLIVVNFFLFSTYSTLRLTRN